MKELKKHNVKYVGCILTKEEDKNKWYKWKNNQIQQMRVLSISSFKLKDWYIPLEANDIPINFNICIGKLGFDYKGLEQNSGSKDENSMSCGRQNKAW